MSQKRLLTDIIPLLNSLDIQYYLTGSWALSYYAQPRSTHDIDFVVNLYEKDVSKFFDEFDLFILNTAPMRFAYNILKTGRF